MEMLSGATDAAIHPSVARRLVEEACGNPLALSELPQALTRDQLLGVRPLPQEIPLAGNLAAVFTHQLPPPDSAARELLDRVAVSADGSWVAIADTLANGRLTLRHPLLRNAVLGGMTEQRRRELNMELRRTHRCPTNSGWLIVPRV